jgi:uncharacterized membrane protein
MPKDYYKILGVSKTASQDDIKKAYRQKALLIHPDVNPSSEAQSAFQELSEAYSILGDSRSKAKYDSDEIIIRFEEFDDETHSQTAERERQEAFERNSEAGSTVDTDYAHYLKSTTRIGLIVLLFSLTFFVDGLFYRDLGKMKVQSIGKVYYNYQSGKKLSHLAISMEDFTFRKEFDEIDLVPGEFISIKKSFIYGFVYFKKSETYVFRRANGYPILIAVTAILVFICGCIGVSKRSSAASKFNAAIIGLFFSLMLVLLFLFA